MWSEGGYIATRVQSAILSGQQARSVWLFPESFSLVTFWVCYGFERRLQRNYPNMLMCHVQLLACLLGVVEWEHYSGYNRGGLQR